MPRFLFWNYRRELPDREEILARLVHHEAIDVIILAESSCQPKRLVDRLSSEGRPYRQTPLASRRFQIFSSYSTEVLRERIDYDRLCLLNFHAPGNPEMILGVVHLASGLHLERSERQSKAATLAMYVRGFQREQNHSRTIVVGDFNLNPFDDGMIFNERGFGAMMTKSLVKKHAISAKSRFLRFYNPLWTRLGREIGEGPPGTFYWNQQRETNIYWNYVDQVLVGHDLLDCFPDSRFRILTAIPGEEGQLSLIRETKLHWKVGISDHLPLVFDLDLSAEANHD